MADHQKQQQQTPKGEQKQENKPNPMEELNRLKGELEASKKVVIGLKLQLKQAEDMRGEFTVKGPFAFLAWIATLTLVILVILERIYFK